MMDRPERLPGPPGPPPLRGLPDNPAQGRRPVPNSAATSNAPTPPPPPVPTLRGAPSNSALAAAANAMSPAQVIGIAREAMRNALESENQAAEVSAVGTGLKTGVTVDLSRRNIQKLPEEVVDIVKNELERLALSHNQLSTLPVRFSECTSLRYLNIRGNQIKEFPMALCDLKALEILDLGRNQLRMLPADIARLSSLKVLSVPKNQIRELPLCLAEMGSLQVLKFEGNPLVFPPKDALQMQSGSPPNEAIGRDTEVTDVALTLHIKRFLKQHTLNGRSDSDNTGDESSESAETPRVPLKRVTSGRFPIKVNGTEMPDSRSPILSRPPPIPSRSHSRGLSQQNAAVRRPGVMPLTIGNVNERLRSNSETLTRSERPDGRSRRMGIVSKKLSDLGTLDETEANNRFSHNRGLSHGSAIQGAPISSNSPAAPTTEPFLQRPIYVRRLSILPERRPESKVFDPILEAAKGILYSVFQVHPMIQMLMSLTNDGSAKRSSLEIVFYNTNSHVEELEQEIQKYDVPSRGIDESSSRDNEHVHRACQTLVSAYGHICTLLADNIDTFVDNGDARYIRTLLMLLYNSTMELRVTLSSVSAEDGRRRLDNIGSEGGGRTIRPYLREPFAAPTVERPAVPRNRSGTLMHNQGSLRVATDVALPHINGSGRTATISSATPRSGDSVISSNSRTGGAEFSEEDAQFDKVFLSLQKSADIVLRTLPNFNIQLTGGLRNAIAKRAPGGLIHDWKGLIAMCNNTIQQTEIMKNRLSMIKLKEPGVRSQANFWNLCRNFIASWAEMADKIKSAISTIPLPPDTRNRLRPIQQSMKETSNTILRSPWHHLFRPSGDGMDGFESQSVSPTRVPITPQSAALGPAMQATVPTTPQSASFAAAFHGSVFERADALIANPGISMSRGGTMVRGHSNFNSLSSISSMNSDGSLPASSAMSPNASMIPVPLRRNGVKGAF